MSNALLVNYFCLSQANLIHLIYLLLKCAQKWKSELNFFICTYCILGEICCILKEKTQKMTNREKCAHEGGSAKRKYLSFQYMIKKSQI
jgi:hypothetical protein